MFSKSNSSKSTMYPIFSKFLERKELEKPIETKITSREISVEEKGDLGFAFDPIFYVPSLGKTFGELTTEEKNQFSHRKNSLKKFIEWYSSQE